MFFFHSSLLFLPFLLPALFPVTPSSPCGFLFPPPTGSHLNHSHPPPFSPIIILLHAGISPTRFHIVSYTSPEQERHLSLSRLSSTWPSSQPNVTQPRDYHSELLGSNLLMSQHNVGWATPTNPSPKSRNPNLAVVFRPISCIPTPPMMYRHDKWQHSHS